MSGKTTQQQNKQEKEGSRCFHATLLRTSGNSACMCSSVASRSEAKKSLLASTYKDKKSHIRICTDANMRLQKGERKKEQTVSVMEYIYVRKRLQMASLFSFLTLSYLGRAHRLVDRLGEHQCGLVCQTGHVRTARQGDEDVVVLAVLALLLGEAEEGEHADLIDDVLPCARRAEALQLVVHGAAHGADALRHVRQLCLPFLA